MDMYTRNVEVIEHAFNQIEKATGISSVEEIVTTFIKAEEQNYSLFNYVNMLNSDIDTIETSNGHIRDQIQHHQKLKNMTEDEKKENRESLEKQIAEYQEMNKGKVGQITSIEDQMSQIKEFVEKMCEQFRNSDQFKLSVASHM